MSTPLRHLRRVLLVLVVLLAACAEPPPSWEVKAAAVPRDRAATPAVQPALGPPLEAVQRWRAVELWDATVAWNAAVAENERRAEAEARRARDAQRAAAAKPAPASVGAYDTPRVRSGVGHADAWWHGVSICEQGGRNDPFFGYFSIMDGSAGGLPWATQVQMANAIIARYGDGAWAASCVARGYAAAPNG